MKRLLLLALVFLFTSSAHAQLFGDLVHATVALNAPHIEQAGKTTSYTFESSSVEASFNGVIVQGFAPEGTEGWIRFAEATGWSAWLPLRLIPSATDASFAGGYRGEVYRIDERFELRFSSEGAVMLSGAGVFDNRKDTDAAVPSGADIHSPFPPANVSITPPVLNGRTAWGAEPFIRGTPVPLANPSYNAITFHHAAGFGATSQVDGLRQVKAIQELHQDVRGWSDIGYQFVMDQSGRLYQGRPFLTEVALEDIPRLAQGAHVGNHNTGNIGVCVLGCYHPDEGANCRDTMTPAAIDSLVTMFAFLSDAYEVAPSSIRGHRDWDGASTACPGDNNHQMIPDLITKVENLLITGNQDAEGTPTAYTLTESFPNPTTGTATIRYFLEQEGNVQLTVYDVLGREVARLEDTFREAGRWYVRTFDGEGLPAGTYFYRVQVEGFSGTAFDATQTLTLIK